MSLGQSKPRVRIPTVMTKKIHALNTPRSRRKLVLTTAAHDWVPVMRTYCRHVHHGGNHEIWRESSDSALLERGKYRNDLKQETGIFAL